MYLAIDGDPLVYACGNASTKWVNKLCRADDPQGQDPIQEFASAEDRNLWVIEELQLTDLKPNQHKKVMDAFNEHEEKSGNGRHIVQEQKEEPVENSLYLVKRALQGVLEKCNPTKYQVYLSGASSFRHELPYAMKYKGHRKAIARPLWYDEIREYMMETWNAKVCEQWEADDQLYMDWYAAEIHGTPFALATVDKDLDQIPGKHYDWLKDKKFKVEPEYAANMLAAQSLAGDATDNIPGLPNIGMATAYKMLTARPQGLSVESYIQLLYQRSYDEQHAEYLQNLAAVEAGELEEDGETPKQATACPNPWRRQWLDTVSAVTLIKEPEEIEHVKELYAYFQESGWK
jgi:hypothetical protein